MQEAQYMDKMMEYWDSLEENEVDGKKFVLIAAICVLAGIIFGMLISPRKTRIGQYYDGGECDCDCDDDDCDCSCGK